MTDTIPFWAKEQLKLRGVYNAWVTDEIERYESLGFHELFKDRKGHALDECGGYTRNFVATYCLTGDERIVAFMKQFRDDWHDTLTKGGHFYHGFPSNEHGDYITHTAEAFTQFLLNVLYLDMEDETTVRMVEDGAEHLGNWHPDVQPFYDWDRHVFQSYFLGTRSPFHRPPHNFQTPRHFRVLQIAVAAYEATHNPRYLDLCKDYCDFWADHILATPDAAEAPTACYLISPDEYREFAKDDEIRGSRQFGYYRNYNENVTAVSTKNGKPCIPYGPVKSLRPPYHILNDPVMTWLEIYKHVPEDRYREAISRYMAGWVDLGDDRPSQVAGQEPHCGVHLPKYRDFTGDKTLDERYIEQWPDGRVCLPPHGRRRTHPRWRLRSGRSFHSGPVAQQRLLRGQVRHHPRLQHHLKRRHFLGLHRPCSLHACLRRPPRPLRPCPLDQCTLLHKWQTRPTRKRSRPLCAA